MTPLPPKSSTIHPVALTFNRLVDVVQQLTILPSPNVTVERTSQGSILKATRNFRPTIKEEESTFTQTISARKALSFSCQAHYSSGGSFVSMDVTGPVTNVIGSVLSPKLKPGLWRVRLKQGEQNAFVVLGNANSGSINSQISYSPDLTPTVNSFLIFSTYHQWFDECLIHPGESLDLPAQGMGRDNYKLANDKAICLGFYPLRYHPSFSRRTIPFEIEANWLQDV